MMEKKPVPEEPRGENHNDIIHIKVAEEFHTCPSCGYARGFHTSLLSINLSDSPVKSTRAAYRVILICPECGARFDVGWQTLLAESESRFTKTVPLPSHDS